MIAEFTAKALPNFTHVFLKGHCMTKKEFEKVKEKIKAENPLLTEDQIEDIIAESESDGGEGAADTQQPLVPDSSITVPDANALTQEKAALAQEKAAIEAEKAALAKEREQLEAEKKALSEKEEAMKTAATPQASGTDSRDNGKAVTYVCKTRCTFNDQYYREGDSLTTTGDVPDFFEAVEEA